MTIRCTLKCLKLESLKTKGLDAETGLKYKKIKKNLNNRFLKLFVNQQSKDLVVKVETLAKQQLAYRIHCGEIYHEITLKLSKIEVILNSSGTIEIGRFDDFVEHKAQIENYFISKNISYSFLNGKFLVNEPENVLELANEITYIDFSWCDDPVTKETDGCFVITHCVTNLADLEKVIEDNGFEIQVDRSEITSTFSLPNAKSDDPKYEDIDEVFEPLTTGETKKLKSRSVTNQFKIKSNVRDDE